MRGLILLAVLVPLAALAHPAGSLGTIALKPCRLPATPGTIEAECASFAVPESTEPGSRTLQIRLALLASRAQQPEPDPVVLLAGGPGQSAIEAYALAQPALGPLLARRNILLVEQRGTGESNPLKCAMPDWKRRPEQSLVSARAQALACLKRYEGKADPRWYATDDYIDDLERVRQAAGIAQFNLTGVSYGTRVALQYLRRHPQAVRSVFLASPVPPELALGQEHARNLEQALATMARRCANEPACLGRYGDLSAGLKALRAQAAHAPRTYALRHPRTHEPMTAPFDLAALGGVVRLFAYAPETLAVLPYLLAEAQAGRPEPLLAQAETLYATLPDQLNHGMELSVLCAEDADLLRADPADAGTLIGTQLVAYTQAQCEVWPHHGRGADFKQPVTSSVPVLIVSGEYDPVTPPRYGEQIVRTLANGRHLVAKGQSHSPTNAGCVPRLLRRFVDTLAPRELDAACLDAMGDAPFFLGAQGPGP